MPDFSSPNEIGKRGGMPMPKPSGRARKRITPSRGGQKSWIREGQTRTKMLMSNPPIRVTERYTNGQWVEVSRQRVSSAGGMQKLPRPNRGMSLGKAIESMQRKKPWN